MSFDFEVVATPSESPNEADRLMAWPGYSVEDTVSRQNSSSTTSSLRSQMVRDMSATQQLKLDDFGVSDDEDDEDAPQVEHSFNIMFVGESGLGERSKTQTPSLPPARQTPAAAPDLVGSTFVLFPLATDVAPT